MRLHRFFGRRRVGTDPRSLAALQRGWDDLAEEDPLFAILSKPEAKHGGWDLSEFLATGIVDVDAMLAECSRHGVPSKRGLALDFGCGVGRMTVALAPHFERVIGLDISGRMIAKARDLHKGTRNVEFVVNDSDSIGGVEDGAVDFLVSKFVLQHLPTGALVERYLNEMCRLLAPGGALVFQLPGHIEQPPKKGGPLERYHALRDEGVSSSAIYSTGLHPITMRGLREQDVVSLLSRRGIRVLEVDRGQTGAPPVPSNVYYAMRAP